jgi:hypothetical protein
VAMVSSRRLVSGCENGSDTQAKVAKARASVKIEQGLMIVFSLVSLVLGSPSRAIFHFCLI